MVALSSGWMGGQAPEPRSGAPQAQGLTAQTSPERPSSRTDCARLLQNWRFPPVALLALSKRPAGLSFAHSPASHACPLELTFTYGRHFLRSPTQWTGEG